VISVRFFAGLREQLGRPQQDIEAEGIATVADVWSRVSPDRPLSPDILMAVNMEYAQILTPVNDGDEVAFFPPVTGGNWCDFWYWKPPSIPGE
jgi:molybdopterin synthase sulfur carrier subunit